MACQLLRLCLACRHNQTTAARPAEHCTPGQGDWRFFLPQPKGVYMDHLNEHTCDPGDVVDAATALADRLRCALLELATAVVSMGCENANDPEIGKTVVRVAQDLHICSIESARRHLGHNVAAGPSAIMDAFIEVYGDKKYGRTGYTPGDN